MQVITNGDVANLIADIPQFVDLLRLITKLLSTVNNAINTLILSDHRLHSVAIVDFSLQGSN